MDAVNIKLILSGVFLLVTVITALVPTCMIFSRKKKLDTYTYETEAVVTDMQRRNMNVNSVGHHDRMWVPTFRYYFGGQVYEKVHNVGTSKKIFEVGDKVPIKVNADAPEKFVQVNSYAHKLAVTILYIIAALFLVFTAVAYILF